MQIYDIETILYNTWTLKKDTYKLNCTNFILYHLTKCPNSLHVDLSDID